MKSSNRDRVLVRVQTPAAAAALLVHAQRVGTVEQITLLERLARQATLRTERKVRLAPDDICGSKWLGDFHLTDWTQTEFAAGYDDPEAAQLRLPIEELDLTARPYNCLKGAGINTVGELVRHTEADLLDIRNLGQKSVDEVKLKLAGLDGDVQLASAA
jgi:hypothetical protein